MSDTEDISRLAGSLDWGVTGTQTSQRFNALDADITYLSHDGVAFKVYKKYTVNSGMAEGFAHDGLDVSENILLEESASVLELLFQFLHPQPQPRIKDLPFDDAASLAEAVEKYRVFPAQQVCRDYMESQATTHPLRVLAYAMRHDMDTVADTAAPLTLDTPIQDAMSIFNNHQFFRWVKYRELWLLAARTVIAVNEDYFSCHSETCNQWLNIREKVLSRLSTRVSSIQNPESLFNGTQSYAEQCTDITKNRPKEPRCCRGLEKWRNAVVSAAKTVPKFGAVTYY